jgi:hypothetical protein
MPFENEILREKLRKEMKGWIELELEARMAAAAEEIAVQADIGANVHCEGTIRKHVTDATSYAEQEMRRELEVEAEKRVEEKLEEYARQG